MAQIRTLQSFDEHLYLDMRWARKSIYWALVVVAELEGFPIDAVEDLEVAQAQAFEIASQLWIEAMDDLEPYPSPASANFAFARRVKDWCVRTVGYVPSL